MRAAVQIKDRPGNVLFTGCYGSFFVVAKYGIGIKKIERAHISKSSLTD